MACSTMLAANGWNQLHTIWNWLANFVTQILDADLVATLVERSLHTKDQFLGSFSGISPGDRRVGAGYYKN